MEQHRRQHIDDNLQESWSYSPGVHAQAPRRHEPIRRNQCVQQPTDGAKASHAHQDQVAAQAHPLAEAAAVAAEASYR